MPPPPPPPMQYKRPGGNPPPPVPKPMPQIEEPVTQSAPKHMPPPPAVNGGQNVNSQKKVNCIGDLPPPPPRGHQANPQQQQRAPNASRSLDGDGDGGAPSFPTTVSSLSRGSPDTEDMPQSNRPTPIRMPALQQEDGAGNRNVHPTGANAETIAAMTLQGSGNGRIPYGERADMNDAEADSLSIQLSELVRENRMNAARLSAFYSPSVANVGGEGSDPAGTTGICTAETPVSLLLARIQRLEMALQLESIQREELETKNQAQLVEIALLTKRIELMKQFHQQNSQRR